MVFRNDRYLQSVEVAGEDVEPFSKLDVARQNKRAAPRSARQPFEPAEVVKLLETAITQGDEQLADLIRLGMWTGCRIEELCSLKVEQVEEDHFSVTDAKTAAGWRDVPIHRDLAQTIHRLVEQSKDGHVLSGLTTNKYGDRSNGIGKRFGKLKTTMGFGQTVLLSGGIQPRGVHPDANSVASSIVYSWPCIIRPASERAARCASMM